MEMDLIGVYDNPRPLLVSVVFVRIDMLVVYSKIDMVE